FTPAHRSLLELYAQLALLIFHPREFYRFQDIQLGKMPSYEDQQPYFRQFEQRVLRKQEAAQANDTYVPIYRVYQDVWREIAEELLMLGGTSSL
ncbi:MAG: hypothetical protein ACRDHZ_05295, partial [Ktedonobacteraceae bacterium]